MTTLENAAKKAQEWTARRNELIGQYRAEGWSLRAIGNATGLSHTAIAKILAK